jgi:hypothetical protein
MVAWILGRTPNTRDTEFTATTFGIIVRTVNLAPGMATANLNPPAIVLGVSNGFFDLLLGMP